MEFEHEAEYPKEHVEQIKKYLELAIRDMTEGGSFKALIYIRAAVKHLEDNRYFSCWIEIEPEERDEP